MKRRTRSRNARLTSEKERRKQFIIKSVVKRGRRVTFTSVSRWVWRTCKIAMVLGLLGGIYWCGTEGFRKLFWQNPDYQLKDELVQVRTDGSLTRDQVLTAAGLQPGKNIFSYELDRARAALRALPQVDTVEIRRYLPNRIEVDITERKPVSWVMSGAPAPGKIVRTHLIDARGMVFKPKRVLAEYQPLPVIGGVDPGDVAPGTPIRLAELSTTLDLLQRVRQSGEFRVMTVDVSKGYCIVVTDQHETQVTFGLERLEEQLDRLRQVRAHAKRIGQTLKTVNVMVVRNIPVTFVPPREPDAGYEELLGDEDAVEPSSGKGGIIGKETDGGGSGKKQGPLKRSEGSKQAVPRAKPVLQPFRN